MVLKNIPKTLFNKSFKTEAEYREIKIKEILNG